MATKHVALVSLEASRASAGITAASTVATGASGASAGLAVFGMNPGVLGALGLTAAVSAGLTELEYQYEKKSIKRMYDEELSSILKKPIAKLKGKDLDVFVKGDAKQGIAANKTIGDAVLKARKQRNIGVVLSVASSLAALAAVGCLVSPALVTLGLGAVSTFIVEGIAGLLAYNAIKQPVHWVADKFFGMDDKTTNDFIVDIARDREAGKIISQEQVMGVYVAAHKELDEMVESRYGDKYEDLPLAVKQAVTRDLSAPLHIDRLTQAINQGKVNVTELAFAVDGQASGATHDNSLEQAKPGRLRSVLAGIGGAVGKVASAATGHFKQEYPAMSAEMSGDVRATERSFVERLGLARGNPNVTHVDRLEQQASDGTLLTRP